MIFSSREGATREKDYAKAYNFALRDAFVSFESIEYEYQAASENTAPVTVAVVSSQKEVEQLKEEIKALKEEKELQVQKEEPVVEMEKEAEPVVEMQKEVKEEVQEVKDEIIETKAVVALPVVNKESPVVEQSPEMQETKAEVRSDVLYAQPIDNGFQLVDTTPKVIYKIKRAGTADTYFVEGKQAIIYKSGSDWILEYYENDILKKEVLNIKF